MNELEQMHDACLIEIVCTSTITTDLHHYPAGETKVQKYDRIHASGMFYLTETHVPDATPGPVLRKSRFFEIYTSIFGNPQPQQSASQLRSLRDALHIDQCWSNMVDYFVTEETALHGCANMDFTTAFSWDATASCAKMKSFWFIPLKLTLKDTQLNWILFHKKIYSF